ncbi:hypothetical protein AV530_016552 [Patagioenas fasciata monilis]|uniref:Uncharacterized protein n=1 Tax=Patagioenas fasciata monilis TaxID=372326 RepID=A0A1V4J415_PATFA|nr:hypothetical protein AV530_016552 [Patagioenas fasciata monilis]
MSRHPLPGLQKLLTCMLKTQPIAGCGSTETGHCCVLSSLAHFSKHIASFFQTQIFQVKYCTVQGALTVK